MVSEVLTACQSLSWAIHIIEVKESLLFACFIPFLIAYNAHHGLSARINA